MVKDLRLAISNMAAIFFEMNLSCVGIICRWSIHFGNNPLAKAVHVTRVFCKTLFLGWVNPQWAEKGVS